ncbi:MAG: hypothetical protein A3F09_05850 [Chlamydiae bacterium RIFCSPHIGHO2_12_FULL_49_11]|nr:MAG: hypothetical protein A3F09_05850 [Chlamydiae bacterium RIFCSPHIGHO2_12_FULL_49_11]
MAKVGFLGTGAWGITLADLIAKNGHEVLLWGIEEDVLDSLEKGKGHPKFPAFPVSSALRVVRSLQEVVEECDLFVECVTAKGFRPVLEKLFTLGGLDRPFIITSKGIEQETGQLLAEVALEYISSDLIGYMSGPTLAKEVMQGQPTAAVAAGKNPEMQELVCRLFDSPTFCIETSFDIMGVALGGAMKNVIAIASGIAEGLGFGHNTKAMLIVRGLREMCRMAKLKGARDETCYGLAGIGDLIVTGVSNLSRNFQFGRFLGEGVDIDEARKKVGMVIEGEYTVLSAYRLGQKNHLDLPITYAMYQVLYEGKNPREALLHLLEEREAAAEIQ